MRIHQSAFETPGKMLKGNMHTHTTRSDGQSTPYAAIRQYASMGFDFLSLTDHRVYNDQDFAPEAGLLILPGMELDGNMPDAKWPRVHCAHIVSVGPQANNGFAQDQRFASWKLNRWEDAQEIVDTVNRANNLPIFCHPQWSGNTAAEIAALKDFSLMEIWNSGCAIENELDTNAAYWDELLEQGRVIYGVASDDTHHPQQAGRGFVRVRAEKNADSILDALKRGAFYASCGPEIYDFYVEDDIAVVICSPASAIRFRHFRCPYPQIKGQDMTGAQVKITPDTNYIRVEVTDAQGHTAWSNPIFLK